MISRPGVLGCLLSFVGGVLLWGGAPPALHAQEVVLVAAGDIEWSRMVREPVAYSVPGTTEVEMEVRGVGETRSWITVPHLNLPENREEIARRRGTTELDSPNAHHLVSIEYDLPAFSTVEEEMRYPFERIREVIQGGDIAFANLEMPLSARARPTGAFVGDPAFAPALEWAGFDVVSFANNHSFDGEEVGLLDTMEHLERAGVGWIGAGRNLEDARRPHIIEQDGVRIAFLGYARSINWIGTRGFAQPNRSGVMPMDPLLIREDIRRVRDQVDLVALSFHWAVENSVDTHSEAREFAYEMIDAGADMILGHHPHVPRGVEVYNGGVIFYSLGNLIFGHNHTYWGDGYAARLTLTPDEIRQVELIPIAGEGQDMAQPYALEGERAQRVLELVQELSEDLDTQMDIVGDMGVIRPAVVDRDP